MFRVKPESRGSKKSQTRNHQTKKPGTNQPETANPQTRKPNNQATIVNKILFITSEFPPQPGGIGVHAHQLARHLSNRFEVEILADQRSNQGEDERKFDKSHAFKITRVFRLKFIFFTYLQRISLALQKSKTSDLILVSGKFSLWLGGLLSLFSSKPIIAIIHGSEVQLSNTLARKMTNWSLSRLNEVIAVSNFTLSLIKDVKLKSTCVIPNGIYLEDFKTKNQSLKTTKNSHQLQLITVGNLTQRKGQHNVINALPKLIKKHPNLKYHCVGIPTDEDRIKELISRLNIKGNVIVHGRLMEEEKNKLIRQSAIFMMLSEHTSKGDVEGFGIAILEANALGLPAIGSENCGIEDAIKDGYSGKLVNQHQPQEIEQAIEEIVNNYGSYSSQAKLHAQQFDWSKIGAKYIEVLQRY